MLTAILVFVALGLFLKNANWLFLVALLFSRAASLVLVLVAAVVRLFTKGI